MVAEQHMGSFNEGLSSEKQDPAGIKHDMLADQYRQFSVYKRCVQAQSVDHLC